MRRPLAWHATLLTLAPCARPKRDSGHDTRAPMIDPTSAATMTAPDTPARKRTGLRILRLVLLLTCLPLVTGGLLLAAGSFNDGQRVPAELAAWKQQSGDMVCTEGAIRRGNGSLVDRLLDAGTFRCAAWRMRFQKPTTAGLVEWPTSPRR